MAKKTDKSCEKCGGQNLKTRRVTYPIKMETRQIDVGRVSVQECMDCHNVKPTKAGQEKIERCVATFMEILEEHNISSV
jgi:hypothetical protein